MSIEGAIQPNQVDNYPIEDGSDGRDPDIWKYEFASADGLLTTNLSWNVEMLADLNDAGETASPEDILNFLESIELDSSVFWGVADSFSWGGRRARFELLDGIDFGLAGFQDDISIDVNNNMVYIFVDFEGSESSHLLLVDDLTTSGIDKITWIPSDGEDQIVLSE